MAGSAFPRKVNLILNITNRLCPIPSALDFSGALQGWEQTDLVLAKQPHPRQSHPGTATASAGKMCLKETNELGAQMLMKVNEIHTPCVRFFLKILLFKMTAGFTISAGHPEAHIQVAALCPWVLPKKRDNIPKMPCLLCYLSCTI